jgi:FHS family glucose/mannose:H+ symporter-like MFS transporter
MAPGPRPGTPESAPTPTLEASTARKALSVFFLSGMLLAFPGAILPAWGYHIRFEYSVVGNYFLAISLGILASVKLASMLRDRRGIRMVLLAGGGLACAAFLWLAMALPPAHWGWRMAGMAIIGVGAGTLASAAFHCIAPSYQHNPAAAINLAGAMFGLGCLVTALLIAGTFYVYTVASILILLAVIPGFLTAHYWRSHFQTVAAPPEPPMRQAWRDFRSPGAVLFSLILFFQFGNEWSVAGWLTLFLTQRIGLSPEASLKMLSLYWFALLVGRGAAQWLLPRAGHGKLLGGSALSAMLGCVFLISTNNRFGAATGILLVGGGFAMIYPLVVEKIGHRFPHYRPGLFNGLFSFAVAAGFFAPWTQGLLADVWGIQVVMLAPLAGSAMVFLLLMLLWIETKLTTAP